MAGKDKSRPRKPVAPPDHHEDDESEPGDTDGAGDKTNSAPFVAIVNINGQSSGDPVTVSPPGPWPVIGTVSYATGTTIQAMTFQVVTATNPVRSFPPPNAPLPNTDYTYNFSIPATDVPCNGAYLLCVTAYYSDNTSRPQYANFQGQNFTPPPPPTPPPTPPPPLPPP